MDIEASRIIHFSHIPKCGGTSFRKGLEEAYGDRLYQRYINPLRHRRWDMLHFRVWRLKNNFFPKQLPSGYDIIYGHFCFDDIPEPPDSKVLRGAFFRDPVEWFGSLFYYTYNKYPEEIDYDPLGFIRRMGLRTGFKKYLGSYAVEDMAFVGLTENYKTSLKLFGKIFGKNIPYYRENVTVNKNGPKITKSSYRDYFMSTDLLASVEKAMAGNQEIYLQAKKRFELLIENHKITT